MFSRRAIALILSFRVTAMVSGQSAWIDPSPHTVSFLGVEQGVAIEVLDWGGTGPALILLAGLGGTAHVFDGFAARLTDHFHVIGLTRRGFSASGRPEDGYDSATLAHDIGVVLDRLAVPRAVLIGHSAAGAEISAFAVSAPERVLALVYLDSAYDFTVQPKTPLPQQVPTTDERSSLAGMNRFLKRTLGMEFPEGEWQATSEFNHDG